MRLLAAMTADFIPFREASTLGKSTLGKSEGLLRALSALQPHLQALREGTKTCRKKHNGRASLKEFPEARQETGVANKLLN